MVYSIFTQREPFDTEVESAKLRRRLPGDAAMHDMFRGEFVQRAKAKGQIPELGDLPTGAQALVQSCCAFAPHARASAKEACDMIDELNLHVESSGASDEGGLPELDVLDLPGFFK